MTIYGRTTRKFDFADRALNVLQQILLDIQQLEFLPNGISIEAEINDVVDILCPKTVNTTEGRTKAEYHTFTQVPYESYKTCNLTYANKTDKTLLRCNRPFVENKYTLLFQAWTPYPRGSTFEAGKDYYYITTSTGTEEGIESRAGGLCNSHNMRLKVHIKATEPVGPTLQPPQSQPQPRSTTPIVHTTTRTAIETSKPVTEEVRPSKKLESANPKDMLRGSANMCQVSSLLLLVSCLMARVRWH
ncbi:ephrin-B2a-like [Anneissia japonica]|uniref:ephrin-B2a-like n=1 Tax=Anneissia japonica TaxID=1529436 RepID=UPI001425980B|nr:ephrin-B2a-like [Anneissia japonica]